jgi:hypothetical protein
VIGGVGKLFFSDSNVLIWFNYRESICGKEVYIPNSYNAIRRDGPGLRTTLLTPYACVYPCSSISKSAMSTTCMSMLSWAGVVNSAAYVYTLIYASTLYTAYQ